MTDVARSSRRGPLSPIDKRALGAVAMQFFVNGAMTASFIARLPEIRDQIGVSIGQLGVLLTVIGAFGLLGSAIAGHVIERWSTRTVLIAGGVAMVCSLPVMGSATSALIFAVGLMAYVFFDVLVDISMNLQGSWISARRTAPVMNRLHGLWSLGSVAGGLLAAWSASAGISLATHLTGVAVVSAALIAVVVSRLLRSDEDGQGEVHDTDPAAPATRTTRRSRLVPLALLALGGAFALVLEMTGSDWAAFRLADDLGAAAGFASLGYVAFTVGMTVGRFGGDWMQVRLGRVTLGRVAVSLSFVGLATASLIDDRWVVLGGHLVAGLGIATLLPGLYDDAAQLPGRRGAGLGVMTAGTRVAGLATPALVGLLAATSLSVGSAIAIVALPSAVLFGVVSELSRRRLRPPGNA